METQTNDTNPQGTKWWNDGIYGDAEVIYPEEDYQIAALPKTLLHQELGRRLGLSDEELTWKGKKIKFSAVSDALLLHDIQIRLAIDFLKEML